MKWWLEAEQEGVRSSDTVLQLACWCALFFKSGVPLPCSTSVKSTLSSGKCRSSAESKNSETASAGAPALPWGNNSRRLRKGVEEFCAMHEHTRCAAH